MKKIFITGGSGYIGSSLIYCLQRTCPEWELFNYDLVEGLDICDFEVLLHIMADFRPDVVIHLAAISSIPECEKDPKLCRDINVNGTKNILQAMKLVDCKNIIFASTSAVYGNIDHPCGEYESLEPISKYAVSKLASEQAIFHHFEIKKNPGNYCIFRMFNIAGKIKNSKLGTDSLFSALESGSLKINGRDYRTSDGTCERDYVSILDTCQAYITILEICEKNPNRNFGEIFNICSGVTNSVYKIALLWNHTHKNLKISFGPRRPGDIVKVVGNPSKIISILAWEPKNDIRSIVLSYAKNMII